MMDKVNFGLIGKNISYSFSKKYFTEKFDKLNLSNYSYENFDLAFIHEFPQIFKSRRDTISGLNVTIPYKEKIINYLDEIDYEAELIGAVNTIKIQEDGKLKGYNTDIYGFENSLKPFLDPHMNSALILGTGGASKAISYVLKKNNIQFKFVSRKPDTSGVLDYKDLKKGLINKYQIIINCTPLGTFPDIESAPDIPYGLIDHRHLLYDLVYNPPVSRFLAEGRKRGAKIKNGEEMLKLQADRAWAIWNE